MEWVVSYTQRVTLNCRVSGETRNEALTNFAWLMGTNKVGLRRDFAQEYEQAVLIPIPMFDQSIVKLDEYVQLESIKQLWYNVGNPPT